MPPEIIGEPTYRLDQDNVDHLLYMSAGARNIALTLALRDDSFISGSEINESFNEALELTGSDHSIKRAYASSQLNGIADNEIVIRDTGGSVPVFAGTNRLPVQQSFAAHIAKMCQDRDMAPIDLVSTRCTPKNAGGLEPYYSRLAIYATMLNLPEGSIIYPQEIATSASINPRNVHNQLGSLVRGKILLPLISRQRNVYPEYALSAEKIDEEKITQELSETGWTPTTIELAKECVALLAETGIQSPDRIRKLLNEDGTLVDYLRSEQPNKQNEMINKVLEWLAEKGVASVAKEASQKIEGYEFGSEARGFVMRYITSLALHIVEHRPTLIVGERLVSEYQQNHSMTAWLLSVDFDKGALDKRSPKAETMNVIIERLDAHPGGFTTEEFMQILGKKKRATHSVLSDLRNLEIIDSQPEGRHMRWKKASEPSTKVLRSLS